MSRRDCLCDAILKYFNQELRRLVVPGPLDGVLPPGTTLRDLALALLNEAEMHDTLGELCVALKTANANPDFHADLDRCSGRDGIAAGGRPRWYDSPLPMKQPLIDRESLRAGLYEMLERDPRTNRLMIVRGDHPGKTYCRYLIQHVAEQLGLEPPVFIDLQETASVQQFAERLVDQIGLSHAALAERFSSQIREGRYFNDWLVGQSRTFGARTRWLIVLDHLAKPGIPQDLADTAIDLAQRAMEGNLKNVWLILLDCPPTESLDDLGPFYEEIVEPIPREAIAGFLDWAVELRRQAGDPAPLVPASIDATLAAPFPLQRAQLQGLRRDIVAWMRRRP